MNSPNLNIGEVLLHVGADVAARLHGQLGRRLALVRCDACQSVHTQYVINKAKSSRYNKYKIFTNCSKFKLILR